MAIQTIVKTVIFSVIGLIVVYQLVGTTANDVGNAANNITASSDTYPLTSLFAKGGVVLLLFMVGLLLYFVNMFMPRK